MTKVCTKCSIEQELTEFPIDPRYKGGYSTWCKSCKKLSARLHKDTNRKWCQANKESVTASKRKYVAQNISKVKQAKRKWSKANSKHQLALTRKYQAAKLRAVPKWLTTEQLQDIVKIYEECPEGYHVDHEVPLQGKNVSGLHVAWNLKCIPASINFKKSNKF